MVAAGMPTGAPNILLTVRGRRTGMPRTVALGMVEVDGRRFVQASYGESGWVTNLRTAGEATSLRATGAKRSGPSSCRPRRGRRSPPGVHIVPPLPPRDSPAARASLVPQVPQFEAELDEITFTPPTHLIEEAAELDLGDRVVGLRFLGRGHTDNDIVLPVDDVDVVFAGDLVSTDAPPGFTDAFPLGWVATLGRLGSLVRGTVVPGHGPAGDPASVRRQATQMATLAELGSQVVDGRLDERAGTEGSQYPEEVTMQAIMRIRAELAEDEGGGSPTGEKESASRV